jgi:transglutaminase-like putative cysteine protease
MLTRDRFDGKQWEPAALTSPDDIDASDPLPAPDVTIEPTSTVTTSVSVSSLKEPYLPLPMFPTTVKARGDWLYNPTTYVVYSKHSTTQRLKYQVTSTAYQPTQDVLSSITEDAGDQSMARYLALPALPPVIKAIADQVVNGAHATTPYQKAVALQAWFQTQFFYDLHAKSGSGTNDLLSCLADKRGYCEQFAATMAVMARLEGIPSRVNVGFTPGSNVPGTSTYVVTTADAHAWPELYFPGAGWLRFEPTPRDDGQTTRPAYTSPTNSPSTTTTTPPVNTAAPSGPVPSAHNPGGTGPTPSDSGSGGGFSFTFDKLPIGWIVVLFLLLLVALCAPLVRLRVRHRRWAQATTAVDRAHAAWLELDDDMRDLGLEWRGMLDSPRRAAAALLATRRLAFDSAAREALARLATAEELARYANPRSGDARLEGLDPRADHTAVARWIRRHPRGST